VLGRGLSINTSVVKGVVQFGHLSDKEREGLLQMRTSAFLAQKTLYFLKFMVYPHG